MTLNHRTRTCRSSVHERGVRRENRPRDAPSTCEPVGGALRNRTAPRTRTSVCARAPRSASTSSSRGETADDGGRSKVTDAAFTLTIVVVLPSRTRIGRQRSNARNQIDVRRTARREPR